MDYFLVFGVGILIVLMASHVFVPIAKQIGLLDYAGGRKRHTGSVPLVGGVVFFLVLGLSLVFVRVPAQLELISVFLAAIFVLGLIDDRIGLPVLFRLLMQVAFTAGAFVYAGIELDKLGPLWESSFSTGYFALPLAVIFVVGFVNAYNMIDGVDGLAIGQAMISIISLMMAQGLTRSVPFLDWYVLVLGALVSLLLINTSMIHVKKIFLGDSGSTVIGFLLGWLIIDLSYSPGRVIHPVSALCSVAFPLFDFFTTVMRRIRKNQSIFSGDRNHLHHLLIDSGNSPGWVVVGILIFSGSLSFAGVLLARFAGPEYAVIYSILAFGLYCWVTIHPRRLDTFQRLILGKSRGSEA